MNNDKRTIIYSFRMIGTLFEIFTLNSFTLHDIIIDFLNTDIIDKCINLITVYIFLYYSDDDISTMSIYSLAVFIHPIYISFEERASFPFSKTSQSKILSKDVLLLY